MKTSRRRGSIMIFGTLSLFLLFGMVGLSVDLGWAYFKKQHAQTAADAAAMSAAIYAFNNGYTCGADGVVCGSAYNCASPPVTPATNDLQVGCLYAQSNGFVNTGDQSVSMTGNNTAPPGITGNTPYYWVQANVAETVHNLFLFLPGFRTGSVAAKSMAAVTVVPSASCIYALDTGNTSSAFNVTGSVTVTASCGIYVNSSHATKAYNQTGSANVHATVIQIRGGYSKVGSGSVTPTPTTGAGIVADPFASLPSPTFSGCDHTNWSTSGSGTVTLNPGVYCGGITRTGSGTTIFNSGTYIINGGGFNVAGSGSLSGTDVMFYITGRNGQTPAPLSMSGSFNMTFHAPSAGVYEGILFYQDRSVTYAAGNSFTGSNSSNSTGAYYFPTTALSYSGSSTGHYQALVAKTIDMTGSADFLNDVSGTFTGLASRTTALIQ